MKIGLDGRFWSREAGGLSTYTRELVYNLLKIDHKNQYFLFLLPKDLKDAPEAANLKIVVVNSPHYSIAEQFELPGKLRKYKLDLIHYLNFNHPVITKGKFISTFHDLILFFYPARNKNNFIYKIAMRFVMSNAVNRAEKIIVPSQSTKNDLIKHFNANPEKISIIPDGIASEIKKNSQKEIENFKAKKGLKKPYILYVGQWRPHKNLSRLVEAFDIAKKNAKVDFQLVLGGKPDKKNQDLLEKINQSKFKKDIIVTGFIDDSELSLWYNSACAFVFPSLYEGFGLPPLEALSAGLPVISSDSSSMPEVLEDSAIYFDPKNTQEMARAIKLIVDDPDLRKHLSEKGIKQAKKFSFEKMAKETLEIYNNI